MNDLGDPQRRLGAAIASRVNSRVVALGLALGRQPEFPAPAPAAVGHASVVRMGWPVRWWSAVARWWRLWGLGGGWGGGGGVGWGGGGWRGRGGFWGVRGGWAAGGVPWGAWRVMV